MPQSGRDSANGSQSGQTQGAQNSAIGTPSVGGIQPGNTGQDAGTGGASTVQGSSAQTAGAGQADASSQVGGAAGSGNYSLDNLPGGLGDNGAGPQTAQERTAVLNGALNRGYEDFDGVILAERARAQAQANAARNTEIPGDSGGGPSSGAGTNGQPIIISSRANGPNGTPQGSPGVGGGSSNRQDEQTFPPPEDIPSGRDDDIVARQLREAAMREADPELREALWDEYRKYTGIGN